MLAALLNTPTSNEEWQHFSFDHRDSHDRIRAAILQQRNVNLADYQVDPINPQNTQQFLENNSNLHTEMNEVLRSQSSNVEDVDFNDPNQLRAWIALHYQEHLNAEQLLGI